MGPVGNSKTRPADQPQPVLVSGAYHDAAIMVVGGEMEDSLSKRIDQRPISSPADGIQQYGRIQPAMDGLGSNRQSRLTFRPAMIAGIAWINELSFALA